MTFFIVVSKSYLSYQADQNMEKQVVRDLAQTVFHTIHNYSFCKKKNNGRFLNVSCVSAVIMIIKCSF